MPNPMGARVDAAAGDNATSGSSLATSLVVKAAKGTLYGFTVYNSKGSAQFIQIHDAAALPADNAVPIWSGTVGATSNLVVDFGLRGKRCDLGIVLCNSSTAPTKTIGSADCFFAASYS